MEKFHLIAQKVTGAFFKEFFRGECGVFEHPYGCLPGVLFNVGLDNRILALVDAPQ